MSNADSAGSFPAIARSTVHSLRASKIREAANAGMGREGAVPFWFGEPDVPTSEEIRVEAIQSLQNGETFYVQTLGQPQPRDDIAAFVSRLHTPRSAEHVAVTGAPFS
ncbi:hypothetical protein [Paraburkholderia sp. HD33-4]|uniref:hypothetical protein n=1 Tax=Paraburkholderia sp. HD33-4 TaxID=2883242 RepID=UPI001F308C5F|nr:hypothetical protein [Paraburkholderia sp. HD33-4]